jgi:hypothetical protein
MPSRGERSLAASGRTLRLRPPPYRIRHSKGKP